MTQPSPPHVTEWLRQAAADQTPGTIDDPARLRARLAPKVLGLDLSLTCTGIAGNGWTEALKPPPGLRGVDRILWIRDSLTARWLRSIDLAAVEGPSYGSQGSSRQSGHHERAGLWWTVVIALRAREIPVAVIPPASLKKYATGRGNADKSLMVLAAARHWKWYEGTADEADALWLAAMAAHHLGHPLADMPKTHRAALDAVQWPDLPAPVVVPHQTGHTDHTAKEAS
ncbi:hypothetical protein [Micromonospora sp. NPDC023633]|uniref:hypothetical protein n=1 Tax=Micromonospora sp. NPDC023633 TaxID=3154320 RepID=UPI0033FA8DC7